jgi:sugar phosphate isomerase/epimerase
MKLAFSTNAYIKGDFTLLQAMDEIAKAGYRGVEILAENPLLWPFDITPKEIKKIKTFLKEKNLQPVNLNACVCASICKQSDFSKIGEQKGDFSRDVFGPCLCDFEEENRALRTKYMKKVIDLAVELEIKDISTLSGFTPMRGSRKLALENMRLTLARIIGYAEEKGIRINIEYEPGLLIGSAEEAIEEILIPMNSASIGLNFDIGHAFVAQEDIVKIIENHIDKIHNVHIEDIGLDENGDPVHYHLIPGLGAMPLEEICIALERNGFEGWYIVELYTYLDKPVYATRESMKYMKKLAKK